jgi:TRAP-type uncharacterized transport system substrate-binding protein
MELSSQTIITGFLALIIILYAYNDFIKPLAISLYKSISNSITNKTPITEAFTSSLSEAFSSQYSSHSPSLSNTVQFDTNSYLRDGNKPIIINNQISLPVLTYAFTINGSYNNLVGDYMRKHIYPIQQVKAPSNIDIIYKFLNKEIDIAFVSEEVLVRFIKRDCKYLTRLLAESFNIDLSNINNTGTPDKLANVLDRLYPPLNISAIGVGFHVDFYLMVNNFSNIIEFLDIRDKKVGVLADSYYFYVKICASYGIDPNNAVIGQELEPIIESYSQDKYDAIFIVVHPKNKQLLELSLKNKMRYIHIQKRAKLDSRNNLNSLVKGQQGNNSETLPPPPDINRQAIYSQTVMDSLKTVNITEDYNKIIKKYFQHIVPRTVDLNKFHKSGNMYSYLETFSTRMILMIRDDIPKERAKYITRNYIDNLERMRDTIDKEQFTIQLNNFSSLEFNYQELISFDPKIELSEGSKEVYKDEGLIYYGDETRCDL